MHEFSTVDGFVEMSECMAEMTKYVANEPSVGLFFIQQHAQKAVPNVTKDGKSLFEKVHETTLHTEDLADSIASVRSMKECGYDITGEMIVDIKKSLATMATKQPKKGLIHPSTSRSNSQTERASFWGNHAFYAQVGHDKRSTYFSNVLKSAKQKVNSLKGQQADAKGLVDSNEEKPQMFPDFPLLATSVSITSSQVEDDSQHDRTDTSDISIKLLSVSERYDDFKANKEAKLEDWPE